MTAECPAFMARFFSDNANKLVPKIIGVALVVGAIWMFVEAALR